MINDRNNINKLKTFSSNLYLRIKQESLRAMKLISNKLSLLVSIHNFSKRLETPLAKEKLKGITAKTNMIKDLIRVTNDFHYTKQELTNLNILIKERNLSEIDKMSEENPFKNKLNKAFLEKFALTYFNDFTIKIKDKLYKMVKYKEEKFANYFEIIITSNDEDLKSQIASKYENRMKILLKIISSHCEFQFSTGNYKLRNNNLFHELGKAIDNLRKRKLHVNLKTIIISNKIIRKNNSEFKTLTLISKEKFTKFIPQGIFKDNFLRSKGKAIAFERKKVNSPYLFYQSPGTPIILHLHHLLTKYSQSYNFYNQFHNYHEVEQHEGFIYICGGYLGNSQATSTGMSLSLSKIKSSQAITISNLNEARAFNSLVSTPFGLYAIGGCNWNPNYLSSCERYQEKIGWSRISNLNVASHEITASFVYLKYVYTFGGIPQTFERLEVKCKDKANWEKMNIPNNQAGRYCGCTFQMNEDEILVYGGTDEINAFSIFHVKNNSIEMTGKTFNGYAYYGSKTRLLLRSLHIVSKNSSKRILIS